MATQILRPIMLTTAKQKMPIPALRRMRPTTRGFSSTGAGPSTFRARPRVPGSNVVFSTQLRRFPGHRHFSVASAVSSTFDALQNTLTYPTSFISHIINNSPIPSHGATIILLALFLRTVLTLPPTLWQRRQRDKMESLKPELKAYERKKAHELIRPYRIRGDEKGFMLALAKEVRAEQEYLYKINGLHPYASKFGPFVFNLSLLITMSTAVRAAMADPSSAIAQESFAWIQHLGQPDLFISLSSGFVAFGIAELSERAFSESRPQTNDSDLSSTSKTMSHSGQKTPSVVSNRPASPTPSRPLGPPPQLVNSRTPKAPAEPRLALGAPPRKPTTAPPPARRPFSSSSTSEMPTGPGATGKSIANVSNEKAFEKRQAAAELVRRILPNVMRAAALGLIFLTSQMPAGVTLYICTSLVYTLTQLSIFRRIDKQRLQRASR